MKCETCLNSRIGISENGYNCVCTLSAKKAANCITNDYRHYVKSTFDIPQKPITNADRIRRKSDEELAEFMCHNVSNGTVNCAFCAAAEFCRMGHNGWLDWLREEAVQDAGDGP